MRKLTRTLVLDCDPETFWKVFFDDEYIRRMHLDGLGFREIEILEKTDTRRRLRAVPALDIPETVAKLLGDRFGYEERGTVDREKGEWRWSMAPNALGDKLRTEGTVTIESAPGGKTRRHDNVVIEAKLFGVGSLIEGTAEKQLRASWEKEETFLKRWLGRSAS
jgi:hypothetical protein